MIKRWGRLDNIIIQGYKSIKSLDLDLKPLNILIGANGVGKSNFINFFKFIKKIIDKDLPTYTAEQGGANKILHFGKKITPRLALGVKFLPNAYSATLLPTNDDKFIFKNERVYFWPSDIGYNGDTKRKFLSSEGEKNSKLSSDLRNTEGHVINYIKNWKIYHFHDTGITARIKQTSNINDCEILSSDGANLAAFLLCVKENEPRSYEQIVKTIQRVAPFFHDFILEPEIYNKETIRLKWKHKGNDEYFDANDLSDGTLRFMCLTALLLQPNLPTIIILDEPELGLHPFALKLLAAIFRTVSHKTQIIASTQSVTLADEFDIEDIIVVDRIDNHSEFRRLDKDKYKEWLEEYSVGEVWQKNLIGGVPNYD